jgi:adenylate cyclase
VDQSFLTELSRRRIPQVLGVYLAAGWGLLEFTDWLTGAFGLSVGITLAVLGIWAALLPAAMVLAWRLGAPAEAETTGAPGPSPVSSAPSVGVLPFVNLGPDPADEYLGDGLSDEILTALARVEGLKVASRTSGFAFRDSQLDVREIGQRMGVAALLEGSVRRDGDRIRVITQLVSAADGYHLWARSFDRSMDDLLAIEIEIAEQVAEALAGVLRGPPRQSRTEDPRAYEYFLRGRHYLRQWNKRSLLFARDMFRSSVARDPEFARGWAAIADTVYLLCTYYPSARAELAEAEEAATRALRLAPDLAESHSALGSVRFLQGRTPEAAAAFERAIELDPTLFVAHYFFARANFQMGRLAEAESLFERAGEVEPRDYQSVFFRAQSIEAQGRHDEALQVYSEALGRSEEWMDLYPDDARAATMRAVSLCRLGRADEGLEWGRGALKLDPEDAGVRYNVACLYALEGMTDEALKCLEEAVEVGFGNREWLEKDPDIESLRGHPRFKNIMARAGG